MTKKCTRFLCKILIVFALMFSTFTYTHVLPVTEVEADSFEDFPHLKLITRSYPTQNAPSTFYYDEYDSSNGRWYAGTLTLTSVVRTVSEEGVITWTATFVGWLYPTS